MDAAFPMIWAVSIPLTGLCLPSPTGIRRGGAATVSNSSTEAGRTTGAADDGSRRSGRQAERRQAAERRSRSAERSGLPGRTTTRSTGTDRRGTTRWASLNVAPAREAVGGSARSAVAPGATPSAGGGGRGGSQQARRRQVAERRGRSAERGRRPGGAAARSAGAGRRMTTRSTSRALSGSTRTAEAPGEAPAGVAEAGVDRAGAGMVLRSSGGSAGLQEDRSDQQLAWAVESAVLAGDVLGDGTGEAGEQVVGWRVQDVGEGPFQEGGVGEVAGSPVGAGAASPRAASWPGHAGGAALLGRRVRVVWPAEGASFDGTVHSWSPVDGQHEVWYDDGDIQRHDLSEEQVEWLGHEQEQQPQEGVSPASPPRVEGLVDVAEDADAGGGDSSVGELSPVVAAVVAAVGTPQSNSRPDPTDGLESPPVPEGLVGLLGTPDRPSEGRDDPLVVAGVTSPGSADRDAPQLGAPRPSPGMERQRFVGPLFRPVEGEWYGHVMRSMPPSGIIRDGVATTFSWFFCPLILDAVGWESAFPYLPRDAGWNEMVSGLARVLREAGVTWEVIAGYILEEGMHPFHFSRQRQEQLIQMDQQLGQEVQMFASGLVASARLLETGRGLVGSTGGQGYRRPRGRALVGHRLRVCYPGSPRVGTVTEYQPAAEGVTARHVIQWDDTGMVDVIDLPNSRIPVEFLSRHGSQVLWRHARGGTVSDPSGAGQRAPEQPSSPSQTHAASQPLPERRADAQRGGPSPSSQPAASRHTAASHRQQQRQAAGSGGVPRTFLSLVAEACDGPVVEGESSSGGAGTPGGEHALLDACALEALLRGEAGGADTFTHHQGILSRNLTVDELDGISRFLDPPESVVFQDERREHPFISDRGWADEESRLFRGSVVSPSLRAAWRHMREADARRYGPLPEQDTLVVEVTEGAHGYSGVEAATALHSFRVQESGEAGVPEWSANGMDLGDACSICTLEWESGQGASQWPCGHSSHQICAGRWLVQNGSCTICRSDPIELLISQRRQRSNQDARANLAARRASRTGWGPEVGGGERTEGDAVVRRPLLPVIPAPGSAAPRRERRRRAVDFDGDPPPGEDEPAFRCPVCTDRVHPNPFRMSRHLRQHHVPDDYALTDLSAFGCASCPRCEVAFASGAPLTSHFATCASRVERGGGEREGDSGAGGAHVGGAPGAARGGRPEAEALVDPVIPDASWAWLRGLDLAEVFACPCTTARHVPKRARNQFAEAMRWVMRSLGSGDEDYWRLLGLAPRLLLGSIPGARKKTLPAEVVRERVRCMLAGDWEELFRVSVPSPPAWLARASEERTFADMETLEALRDLHPAGDGLPGRVQAAPLELDDAVVEAECRRLPVASGPGCSQLRFEHIGVIFGRGDGLPAIKHACQQLVEDRVPAGVLPWLMGARLVALLKPGGGVRPIACGESLRRLAGKVVCRQMRTRWATYFSPPPLEGANSSAAQLGVGVPGGAEVCVHTVQALLGACPSWCDLALDCKNAFNTVKRGVIYKEVSDNFPELLGLAESSFRHEARLGWQGDDGEFRWVSSAEGAQQGDPLGPFFMAVALQPALQTTLDEHPDVFIMAYLDDIHILGPPDKVRAAYDTIFPLLRAARLELNVPKSTVFCPDGACPEFDDVVDEAGTPMPGAAVPLPGIKVLGIPVGSDRWVADKCVEMALAAGGILPKLARLDDPQVQLLLLRYCAHPRFMHLVGHPVPESLRVPEAAPVWGGFGSSQPTRQKELTNYQHGSDWLRLFDAANTSVRARLLSLSRDGATAHLNALPSDGGFRMRPDAAIISLCLQLGVSIPLVREVSAVGTGRCACGDVVDGFGYHYLACNRRGMFTYQHDAVQDVLFEILRKVFDPASVKRTHTYHRSYSPRWRPDITVLNYDGRGRHLIIDVAIGFPCAQTYVEGAARVPLHTAAAMERRKVETYGDVTPHRLVPFAVEVFGGLGAQAQQLLQDCERRRQDRLGPELATATWSTPTFASYWGQRIMVAMHGAQGFGLHGRALEDYTH
ncbi:hypothetical protein CYMTET_23049 [Cymbomonas tetramitiformis]|uniref:RING-type domain-containing protein n=1 Tax=Cymbomonas tetramitiformis TaxID=36881 RepID=A0AAE0FZ03_9CHLO|nr:hypothetical protein CYMTET_23049 [Cymbomonas tetramitiformis]